MTAPRPRIMTETLAPRLREPPGRPTKIPKNARPRPPHKNPAFQECGSLAGDVSLAILSQRASATARRDRGAWRPYRHASAPARKVTEALLLRVTIPALAP